MRYDFGEFSLSPERQELSSQNEVLAVEPQVFSLLLYLIENRNRVVSKDELVEAVWDGRYISDSAISSRVKSARQAIGDNGKDQAVIKTIHGRGFRFIAEVAEIDDAQPAGATVRQAGPAEPSEPTVVATGDKIAQPAKTLFFSALAVLAVLFVGFAIFSYFNNSSEQSSNTRIAVLPVQNATGDAELEWVELGLMSLVQHALEQVPGATSISPRLILSQAEQYSGASTGELIIDGKLMEKLAKVGNATHFVVSRLSSANGKHRLDYVVYNGDRRGPEKSVVGSDPTALAGQMGRDLSSVASGRRWRTSVDRDISKDPFVLEAYARGRALQLEGKAEESRDLFNVAASQEPENIWLQYEYALSTRMMGEYDDAKELFVSLEKRAEINGDREAKLAILNALGITYMRLNDSQEALQHSQKAADLANELGEFEKLGTTLINVGIQHRRLGNYEESQVALNRARSAFSDAQLPAPVSLLNSLALLKWDMKDLRGAEENLQEALERLSSEGNKRAEGVVLKNLGDLAETQGDWETAEQRYLQSLRVRDQLDDIRGSASSHSALAKFYLKKGMPKSARAHASSLLELFSNDAPNSYSAAAHSYIGDAYRLEKNPQLALAEYEKAKTIYVSTSRERGAKHQDLKAAWLRLKPFDELRGEVAEIRRWADENGVEEMQMEALLALAELSRLSNKLDDEALELRDALLIAGNLPSPELEGVINARLGRNALSTGDSETAAAFFGLAAEKDGDHFEVLFLAAMREAEASRFQRAAELVEEAKLNAGANWGDDHEEFYIAVQSNTQ